VENSSGKLALFLSAGIKKKRRERTKEGKKKRGKKESRKE